MSLKFLTSWKRSKQPGRQRLYRYNAPLHTRRKFIRAHLSRELRLKYNRRSFGLRKGDKVKIVRGQFKKHEGKIERINSKKEKLYISGVEAVKKDGTKVSYSINPTNVMIMELNLDDKTRQKIINRKVSSKKTRKKEG